MSTPPKACPFLPALALVLLAAPFALAQDGEEPPPAPPASGETGEGAKGGEDGATSPGRRGRAPKGEPRRGGNRRAGPPAKESGPPATIAEAHGRLEALRSLPLGGPGSLVQRLRQIRTLVENTLVLPSVAEASGEDLFRLADLTLEAERHGEATGFAGGYLAAEGEHASEASARAILIRSLSAEDRIEEGDVAVEAFRKALPKDPGLASSLRHLGDACLRKGLVEKGLARFSESMDAAGGAKSAEYAAALQCAAETLSALGRMEEARKLVDGAVEAQPEGEGTRDRLLHIRHRLDLIGKPFPDPEVAAWTGEAPLDLAALKGRVRVWHFMAWWMESGREELEFWGKALDRLEEKGLAVVPLTRTTGWNPKAGRFTPGRKPGAEIADIRAASPDFPWSRPIGIGEGRKAFEGAGVRGLPMEVVVDRAGVVRFVRAGGGTGPELALLVSEGLLKEEAPLPGEGPRPANPDSLDPGKPEPSPAPDPAPEDPDQD